MLVCALLATSPARAVDTLPVVSPPVVQRLPHDPQAFTQGLVWEGGLLYESTGRYGHSTLNVRDGQTLKLQQQIKFAPNIFAEGIALVGDELIQLTWQSRVLFVYDKHSFKLKRRVPYPWEGWGIGYDGKHVITSDGSATLRFLDPQNFQLQRSMEVRADGVPLEHLNELEYVKGEILANVYYTDRIARISPRTGEVLGWIDLSHLYPWEQRPHREAVLNGIAYDAEREVLIVTGKYWPEMFELSSLYVGEKQK